MTAPNSIPLHKTSSTGEALERADQVTFEKLADGLLCYANPDYNAIMHFGINSKGKTVKSPVDGFCKVPKPATEHFIYVQHTTTEIKSLLEKWLNEIIKRKSTATQKKREKGDLIKAGELASKLRKEFPEASFTVVLTSNRSVDFDLAQSVLVKAQQLGISVDIWEQTRITRFLDHQPKGNWLRWKYLGIAAEQISEPLLLEPVRNRGAGSGEHRSSWLRQFSFSAFLVQLGYDERYRSPGADAEAVGFPWLANNEQIVRCGSAWSTHCPSS